MDLDPEVSPDFLADARDPWPLNGGQYWAGVLIDPPYTVSDSEKYAPGAACFPSPNALLCRAFEALRPAGRAGLIHYVLPAPPAGAIFVAAIGILCGFNNRIRLFSVFEKPT